MSLLLFFFSRETEDGKEFLFLIAVKNAMEEKSA